ncbi:MAG: TRAP transporter small permease [Chloroflexota bacterium]
MKEAGQTGRLEKVLLWLEKGVMYLAVLVIFSMMAVVVYGVIMRYAFNSPVLQVSDLSSFMMVALTYLTLAYIQREGRHVSVDILMVRQSKRTKTTVGLGVTLFALAVFVIVTWAGWDAALKAWQLGFRAEDSRIPLFPPKLLIPIGAVLMCLQLVADFVHGLASLKTGVEGRVASSGTGRH